MAFVKTSGCYLLLNNASGINSFTMGSKTDQMNSKLISANIVQNKQISAAPMSVQQVCNNQVFMLQPFLLTSQDGDGRLIQTQYQIVQQGTIGANDFALQTQPINILGSTSVTALTNQKLDSLMAINGLVHLNNLYTEPLNKPVQDGQIISSPMTRLTLAELTDGIFAPSIQQQQLITTNTAPPPCSVSNPVAMQASAVSGAKEISRNRCDQCGQEFEKRSKLQRHLKTHEEESLYRCKECRLTFTVQYNLSLHSAIHNTEHLECPECHKTFSRVASLKSHILLHFKEETFPCHICLEEFQNQTQLDRHQKSKHSTNVTTLVTMQSTSAPLPASDNRGQGQSASGSARQSSSKVYTCVHCKTTFDKVSGLKEHLKLHNKFKQSLAHRKHKRFVDRSGFPHSCNFCNKCFQKPSQLERHLRIHTGERPYKCNSCDKAFNQKGALVIHLYRHTGNRPFTCSFCPSTFSQRGNLRAHIQRVHSVVKEESCFKCLHCSCTFKKLGSLNAHVSRCHEDSKGFLLKLMDPQTSFLKSILELKDAMPPYDDKINDDDNNIAAIIDDNINNDNDNNNSNIQEFQLPIDNSNNSIPHDNNNEDNNEDNNADNLIGDMVADNNISEMGHLMKEEGEFSTTIMHDTTTGSLEEHFIRKINGVKWHQCNYCSKEFKKPSDLIRHLRVHTRERPYACPHCDRSFSVKSTLTTHIRTHSGVREFKCNTCNKWFASNSSLHTHSRLHTGVRPFKCRSCDRQFRTSGHRASHEKSLHGNDEGTNGRKVEGSHEPATHSIKKLGLKTNLPKIQEVVLQEPITITEQGEIQSEGDNKNGLSLRPYVCQHCNHAFKKSSHLKQHIRSHTGEKPYTCTVCLKGFVSGGVLKAHMKTHEGVKEHKCTHCHQAFTTNGSMQRHLSTHSEKRDFICPYCQKAFKTRVNCKKHIKTHRQEVALQSINLNQPIMPQQQEFDTTNNNNRQTDASDLVQNLAQGNVTGLNLIEVPSDFVKTLQQVVVDGGQAGDLILQQIQQGQNIGNQQQQQNVVGDFATIHQQHATTLLSQHEEDVLPTDDDMAWSSGVMTQEGQEVRQGTELTFHWRDEVCSELGSFQQHLLNQNELTSESQTAIIMEDPNNLQHQGNNSNNALQQHQQQQRTSFHSCDICSATFISARSLKRHASIHESVKSAPKPPPETSRTIRAPHTCHKCLLTFRNSSRLVAHLRQQHPDNKRSDEFLSTDEGVADGVVEFHAVDEAGKLSLALDEQMLFEVKEEVSKNVEGDSIEHSLTTRQKQQQPLKKGPKNDCHQLNKCLSCDKTFKKPSDLVRHVRIHTGEKPYPCPLCSRRFTVKSTLDSHLNTHNPGDKKFQCHVCNSSFSTKGSLKVHMRLHTGSRPFKCLYCDQRFRTSGHRKSHMSHHLQLMMTSSTNNNNNLVVDLPATEVAPTRRQKKSRAVVVHDAMSENQMSTDELVAAAGESFEESGKMRMVLGDNVLVFSGEGNAEEVLSEADAATETFYDAHVGQSNAISQVPYTLDFANSSGFSIAITDSNGNSEIVEGEAALQLLQSYFAIDATQQQQQQDDDQQMHQSMIVQPQNFVVRQQQNFAEEYLVASDQSATANNPTLFFPLNSSLVQNKNNVEVGDDVDRKKDSTVTKKKNPSNRKGVKRPNESGNQRNKDTKRNKSTRTNNRNNKQNELMAIGQQTSEQQFSLQALDDILKQHQQQAATNADDNNSNMFTSEIITSADGDHSNTGLLTPGVDAVFLDQGYLILQSDFSENFMNNPDSFIQPGVVSTDCGSNPAMLQPMEVATSGLDPATISLSRSFMLDNSLQQVVLLSGGKDVVQQQTIQLATIPQQDTREEMDGNSIENNELLHRCSDCNKTFKKRSQMERHQRIHTGEKPYTCIECGSRFNQMNALKVHLLKHEGVKPHSCPSCPQTFTQKGNLKTHIQRAHKDLKRKD